MILPTLTVSQLNAYIKKLIDADATFSSVLLSGEISNFSRHYKTGHLYFTIKDEHASVKAVMFSRDAARLRFRPADGLRVIAAGRVSVFERDGTYQLYVRELILDGAGDLAIAFDRLKKRLEAKGLFDQTHKKSLPSFPLSIGVITSPTGAALQDILNIIKRRFPVCRLVFAGVTVQGPTAAAEITEAVQEMNRLKAADLIILGRGGGSAEDLWCFNDETLAYAIFESEIPIISAVGHETDFTISDFVSDLRAPTPSAAAELAVPNMEDLMYRSDDLYQRLCFLYKSAVESRLQHLNLLCVKFDFRKRSAFISEKKRSLDAIRLRLNSQYQQLISGKRKRAEDAGEKLYGQIETIIKQQRFRFASTSAALEQLNPLSVLLRGYAIVQSRNVIKEGIKDLSIGDSIEITMSDGTVIATVTSLKEKDEQTDGEA